MILRTRSLQQSLVASATCSLRRRILIQHPRNGVVGRRYLLSHAVNRRLDSIVARHVELMQKMEDNPEDSYTYGKELASLAQSLSLHEKRAEIEAEEASIQELLQECGDDKDMKKECMETLEQCKTDKEALERKIRKSLLPKDENDTRSNAIVEIRAGTGGDEAGLFASELRQTYEKAAKSMSFECEILSESRSDIGGIKETVLSISARGFGGMVEVDDDDEDFKSSVGPYGLFRYESGVHRVQRVPVNDTRIQTSAVRNLRIG
jgi:peptide chain release factor 1